jgi:hypothetical protein
MREDGLCVGYGVAYEQWRDEFNCSVGDSEHVHEILEWLATERPMLWAKFQERKYFLFSRGLTAGTRLMRS